MYNVKCGVFLKIKLDNKTKNNITNKIWQINCSIWHKTCSPVTCNIAQKTWLSLSIALKSIAYMADSEFRMKIMNSNGTYWVETYYQKFNHITSLNSNGT